MRSGCPAEEQVQWEISSGDLWADVECVAWR